MKMIKIESGQKARPDQDFKTVDNLKPRSIESAQEEIKKQEKLATSVTILAESIDEIREVIPENKVEEYNKQVRELARTIKENISKSNQSEEEAAQVEVEKQEEKKESTEAIKHTEDVPDDVTKAVSVNGRNYTLRSFPSTTSGHYNVVLSEKGLPDIKMVILYHGDPNPGKDIEGEQNQGAEKRRRRGTRFGSEVLNDDENLTTLATKIIEQENSGDFLKGVVNGETKTQHTSSMTLDGTKLEIQMSNPNIAKDRWEKANLALEKIKEEEAPLSKEDLSEIILELTSAIEEIKGTISEEDLEKYALQVKNLQETIRKSLSGKEQLRLSWQRSLKERSGFDTGADKPNWDTLYSYISTITSERPQDFHMIEDMVSRSEFDEVIKNTGEEDALQKIEDKIEERRRILQEESEEKAPKPTENQEKLKRLSTFDASSDSVAWDTLPNYIKHFATEEGLALIETMIEAGEFDRVVEKTGRTDAITMMTQAIGERKKTDEVKSAEEKSAIRNYEKREITIGGIDYDVHSSPDESNDANYNVLITKKGEKDFTKLKVTYLGDRSKDEDTGDEILFLRGIKVAKIKGRRFKSEILDDPESLKLLVQELLKTENTSDFRSKPETPVAKRISESLFLGDTKLEVQLTSPDIDPDSWDQVNNQLGLPPQKRIYEGF